MKHVPNEVQHPPEEDIVESEVDDNHPEMFIPLANGFDVSHSFDIMKFTTEDWAKMDHLSSSDGGSGGVFFVSGVDANGDRKTVVLKVGSILG